MAYPEVPEQTYSYTGFSQSLGDGSFPGPAMDADMANIFGSLESFQNFMQAAFRSDGVLKATSLPGTETLLPLIEDAVLAAALSTAQAGIATDKAEDADASAVASAASAADAAASAVVAQQAAASIDGSDYLHASQNLGELTDRAAARTNLGLSGLAVLTSIGVDELTAAVLARLLPVGMVAPFLTAAAPTGWTLADGKTLGSPTSGAALANVSAQALFNVIWAQMTNTTAPILTSAGGASTRGASAAADWDAGKRITTPDLRGEFIRGLDSGRAVDAGRLLGTPQADLVKAHTHTVSGTGTGTAASAGAHTHPIDAGNSGSGDSKILRGGTMATPSNGVTESAGAHTHTVSVTAITATAAANVGVENRPRNVALAYFIKL